jgi:hypothetical protein
MVLKAAVSDDKSILIKLIARKSCSKIRPNMSYKEPSSVDLILQIQMCVAALKRNPYVTPAVDPMD